MIYKTILNLWKMNSKLSYEKTLDICRDLLLITYWCTRKGSINTSKDYLVDINQINKWIWYFSRYDDHDIQKICSIEYLKIDLLDDKKFEFMLKKSAAPIMELLKIGNGKISLCGGAIINILKDKYPSDYDLFFHCDSVEEADGLLNKCLLLLLKNDYYSLKYSRSRYVLSVTTENFTIQFIRRVYQSKEQVLFGFDLAASRLGYDYVDGLYATICGGMAFAMRAFPLDVNNFSKASASRLGKYCYAKDYKILLPGLPHSFNEDKLINKYATLTWKNDFDRNRDDYCSIQIADRSDELKFDYDGYVETNCSLLINGYHDNITFTSENLQDLVGLSEELVEGQLFRYATELRTPSNRESISRKEAINFLGDKYKDFVIAHYVDQNDELADSIWYQKSLHYVEKAQQCAKLIKDNSWKYLDSSSKNFSTVHPLNITAKDWYGQHYQPFEIGLSTNRFQMAMRCFALLPNDIINLICEYWLQNEVIAAKNRLFAL